MDNLKRDNHWGEAELADLGKVFFHFGQMVARTTKNQIILPLEELSPNGSE